MGSAGIVGSAAVVDAGDEGDTGRRIAQVIGAGLIGGSIGAGLRARGWSVAVADIDDSRSRRAVEIGSADRGGYDPAALIVFVAVPPSSCAEVSLEALEKFPTAVVTDVASVKRVVSDKVTDARFVGGHPMAGSEQDGVDGSDPDMFVGATWVLTPEPGTDPVAFATVRSVVSSLGANVVELEAWRHDQLVALVSHVPHLTAATLMNLAAVAADENATLLRLAAGGFRDMTRIAAGGSAIWPDICAENRDAILDVLDRLQGSLTQIRQVVLAGDRAALLAMLENARSARVNLPGRLAQPETAAEVRVVVTDRPGVLASVTTLLGEMGVNIWDLEIAHSAEGERGVLVVVVDGTATEAVRRALAERGFQCSIRPVGS